MTPHILGIDHTIILVRDLDAGRTRYERLGFQVLERGVHSAELGTANHCMILGNDYLELLGILEPTAQNARFEEVLRSREGLIAIALKTDDAAAARSELRARGVAAGAPGAYGRPVAIDGAVREVRFVSTWIDDAATPAIGIFLCEHRTPELVWRPAWQQHPNGATAIAGFTILVADPAACERPYGRLFATDRFERSGGSLSCRVNGTRIRFCDGDWLAAGFPHDFLPRTPRPPLPVALDIEVASVDATERLLGDRGVRHARLDDHVYVHPDEAHGVIVVFTGSR